MDELEICCKFNERDSTNGRLIAAAPDMLNLLRDLHLTIIQEAPDELIDRFHELIARIDGE